MNILNFFKTKKKLPIVLIKYGELLDPFFIFYCQNNTDLKTRGSWTGWEPKTQVEINENIKLFKEEWKKDGRKILQGICDILELDFYRNVIPAYFVSINPRPFSDPIVIRADYQNPKNAIDALMHEIIHVLFMDNLKKTPMSILTEMFPSETHTTQSHVIIHAVLKYIYLDVLKEPERLERDTARSKKHSASDYARAWEIVEEHGYKELIKEFIKMYK